MRSPLFRQSTLDRSCSIMGVWILTLTLTLGVLIGDKLCLGDPSIREVSTQVSGPVFVPRDLTTWVESPRVVARMSEPAAGLSEIRPFDSIGEPDFCDMNPNRLPSHLSIKLAAADLEAIVPAGPFPIFYVPFLR